MTRKTAPKWDDPEESKRFLETAKAVEASDDPREFAKALRNVMPQVTTKPTPAETEE